MSGPEVKGYLVRRRVDIPPPPDRPELGTFGAYTYLERLESGQWHWTGEKYAMAMDKDMAEDMAEAFRIILAPYGNVDVIEDWRGKQPFVREERNDGPRR